MIEWMKKNRKELLLPFLCFVLGVLLAIASIQVQEQGTDTKEDQTLALPSQRITRICQQDKKSSSLNGPSKLWRFESPS